METETYGQSPLIAFGEVLRRMQIANEFKQKMFANCNRSRNEKPFYGPIQDFRILPKDKPLEWLPIGLSENDLAMLELIKADTKALHRY